MGSGILLLWTCGELRLFLLTVYFLPSIAAVVLCVCFFVFATLELRCPPRREHVSSGGTLPPSVCSFFRRSIPTVTRTSPARSGECTDCTHRPCYVLSSGRPNVAHSAATVRSHNSSAEKD